MANQVSYNDNANTRTLVSRFDSNKLLPNGALPTRNGVKGQSLGRVARTDAAPQDTFESTQNTAPTAKTTQATQTQDYVLTLTAQEATATENAPAQTLAQSEVVVTNTQQTQATQTTSAEQAQTDQDQDYILTMHRRTAEEMAAANAPRQPLNADSVLQRAREIQQTMALQSVDGRPHIYRRLDGNPLSMIMFSRETFLGGFGKGFHVEFVRMLNSGEEGRFAATRLMEHFAINHFDNEEDAAFFLANVYGQVHNARLGSEGWRIGSEHAVRPGESWDKTARIFVSTTTGREIDANQTRESDEQRSQIQNANNEMRRLLETANVRLDRENFLNDMLRVLHGAGKSDAADWITRMMDL